MYICPYSISSSYQLIKKNRFKVDTTAIRYKWNTLICVERNHQKNERNFYYLLWLIIIMTKLSGYLSEYHIPTVDYPSL